MTEIAKVTPKTPSKFETTRGLLNSMQDQILKALPKHLPADSFIRAVLTLCQKNPVLLECDKYSFLGAVMEAAQLGLVLGREAHLLPFKNKKRGITEVQMVSDYKGLIKLVENSGAVSSVRADVVRVGDVFEEADGIVHVKKFEQGEIRTVGGVEFVMPKPKMPIWAIYAEATRTNGRKQWVVLTMDDIERAMSFSKKPEGPWTDHFIEMAKKTAIRRLAKYIPQSPQLLRMTELEELNDADKSQGLKSLVDSTYEPEYETSEATTVKTISDAGAEENATSRNGSLNIKLLKCFEKLEGIGFKREEIFEKIKVKSFKELEALNFEAKEAVIEALLELELR